MKFVDKNNSPRIYKSYKDFLRRSFLSRSAYLTYSFFLGLAGVMFAAQSVTPQLKGFLSGMVTEAVITVSKFGAPPEEDTLGNINFLLAGYGGDSHQGGRLTDTMIVASYNPEYRSVIFFSIPRDLYIEYPWGGAGRMNALYPSAYLRNDNDENAAADILVNKVKEITGLEIPYYALVDFDGFMFLIDELGGVEIEVAQDIYDPEYPGPNNTYDPFSLAAGKHVLDGETALKYVRTRHTLNGLGGDTNRSKRGQQVVKAAIDRMLRVQNITDGTIGDLIDTYNDHVVTNITSNKALGLSRYIETVQNISSVPMESIVFNFLNDELYHAEPGAFLEETRIEGAYVMIPAADNDTFDDYTTIRDFVSFAVGNHHIFTENVPITVLNGADPDKIVAEYGYQLPLATNAARKMTIRGFDIDKNAVDNTDQIYTGTTIMINYPQLNDEKNYPDTTDSLTQFMFEDLNIEVTEIMTEGVGEFPLGITVVLGNDALSDSFG